MALRDADVSTSENSTQPTVASPLDDVVEAVAKVSLQDEAAADKKTADSPSRPFHVYTRNVLLHLSKSPMVGVPANMPALKDWFGCVTLVSSVPVHHNRLCVGIGMNKWGARRSRTRRPRRALGIAGML